MGIRIQLFLSDADPSLVFNNNAIRIRNPAKILYHTICKRTFSAFVDGPDSDMELSLRSDPILLHSIESLNNNTLVQYCFHNMYGILDQKFGTFLFACVRIWITFFKERSRSGFVANCSQSTLLVFQIFPVPILFLTFVPSPISAS
jgi:hypothetical protein